MSGTFGDPTNGQGGDGFMSGLINTLGDPGVFGMLSGLTRGAAQAAMPTRMPIPTGAALGLAASGLQEGKKEAYVTQLAQQQAKAAELANQYQGWWQHSLMGSGGAAPMGVPTAGGGGLPGVGGGGDAGSGFGGAALDPTAATRLAILMAYSPKGGRGVTGPLLDYARSALPAGGGSYLTPQGAVPTPGALPFLSQKEYATHIPEANVDIWKAFHTPGNQPGDVFGTPAQTLGAPPWIGAPTVPGQQTAPSVPGQSGAPSHQDPLLAWASRVNSVENPTGNPEAKNPQSSAAGNGQFINQTWINTVRSSMPSLTAGKTDDQVLAMRSDPQTSLYATAAYGRQNAGALAQAGMPVTPGTLYMAHGLGAAGAISVLRATPTTPVAAILPQNVISANSYLQGNKTVGDVRTHFDQLMQAPQTAQMSPGSNVAPGVTQRALPGGAVVTTNTRDVQKSIYDNDMKELGDVTDSAKAVASNMTRTYEMRDLIDRMPQMGAGADVRGELANMVETYIKPIPGMGGAVSSFLHDAAALPEASVYQEFKKLAIQAAGLQEKSAVGMRGGLGLTKLFAQANPGPAMQQVGARDIANLQLVQQQMELDYARGLHDHVTSNGQQFATGQSNYVPASVFDRNWTNQDNNKVYFAATQALNGKSFADWTKLIGSDPAKIGAAINVVRRVDPTAQIMWQDGKPHVFSQGGGG